MPPMTQKQWMHFLQQMKRNKELRARTALETADAHHWTGRLCLAKTTDYDVYFNGLSGFALSGQPFDFL